MSEENLWTNETNFNLRGVLDASILEQDLFQNSLRPRSFVEYIGQHSVKDNLSIAISAAVRRAEALDHVLLHGPPGLGKTSLAQIIAIESGVGFKATSGPVLEKAGDLAAILSSLEERDVLFIDEIHRLSRVVEEILYSAMEDFHIDIIIGQGPVARSVKVQLKPFTLIAATTRIGLLTSPLRNRFGIIERVEYYEDSDLEKILLRSADKLSVKLAVNGAREIAKRSRGTPRIANRLLRRTRDFAEERANGEVTMEVADAALKLLEIDSSGLDKMDRLLLTTIITNFSGGPVGLDTLAAALSEDKGTIEEVYEPFLIQRGLLMRTPRGREATNKAYEHLELSPVTNSRQGMLLLK